MTCNPITLCTAFNQTGQRVNNQTNITDPGLVVKLVDATVSKTVDENRAGSIPAEATIFSWEKIADNIWILIFKEYKAEVIRRSLDSNFEFEVYQNGISLCTGSASEFEIAQWLVETLVTPKPLPEG